jgi:hypothetical protein
MTPEEEWYYDGVIHQKYTAAAVAVGGLRGLARDDVRE